MAQALEKIQARVDGVTEAEFTSYLTLKGFIRMKTGEYTGDAAATKAITGVGFQPKFLMVYEQVTQTYFAFKTDQDGTKALVVISEVAEGELNLYIDDQIISLDADGFTVGDGTGSSNYCNLAQVYTYIAFG
jgi:hypothetical protein